MPRSSKRVIVTPDRLSSPASSLFVSSLTFPEIEPSCSSTKLFISEFSPISNDTLILLSFGPSVSFTSINP